MKYPPFVNREKELEVLLKYSEEGYYPIFYLYGPEGCGKTRLLLELAKLLHDKENYFTIYIDVQSISDVKSALLASPEVIEVMIDLIKDMSGPIGKILAYALTKLSQKLSRKRIMGKLSLIHI